MVTSNLCVKMNNHEMEVLTVEKKGLDILFELQKSPSSEKDFHSVSIYVNYLLQNGATYLALYIMKTYSSYNVEASNLAIENSISINSKVKSSLKSCKFINIFRC